jgi:hypothetical protein
LNTISETGSGQPQRKMLIRTKIAVKLNMFCASPMLLHNRFFCIKSWSKPTIAMSRTKLNRICLTNGICCLENLQKKNNFGIVAIFYRFRGLYCRKIHTSTDKENRHDD